MTKTPYEIRLNVLQMAKDMLESEVSAEERKALAAGNLKHTRSNYSVQDVISRASALYEFVDKKSNS